ncbi:MAG TPA: outer membrane protein assembly factor BamB [Burkholderiales bacterium]|nr:outer membrane protein assembly factor BamB [Burkholderiales bacterium]
MTILALRSGGRAAVLALLGAGLAACGGADAVKPAELVDFKPLAKARVAWRASVGEAKPFVFAPAFYDGSVYAASRAGLLARLDGASGKPIWRVDTKQKLSGGVGADADLVLVGSPKGVVLAYSTDGKELWRAQVSSEVLGAPRAAEGMVVVRSADGRFFGLDAATGARKWEHQITLPPLLLRAHPSVTIVRQLVLAGLPAGRVLALDLASGTPVWEALVAQPKGDNELERITDIAAAPVLVSDDQACAAAYQGRVACLDIGKGTFVWGRDASSAGRLGVDSLTVFVTEPNGTILAFDKESGATVWKQDKLLNRGVTGPTVTGDFVTVGDYQGYVHVLDAEEGAFAARIATDGSPIGAEPLRVGDNIVVQTRKGGVFAIAIK